MAKLKKAEKRSAPKKAARLVKKSVPKSTKPDKPITRVAARYPARVPEKPAEPEPPKIDVSVRNVYYDGQYLPALCFRKPGALHVPCVAGDPVNGIRKFTIAAPQHDKSTVLQHGYGAFAAEYTPQRFAGHMKSLVTGLRNPAPPVQPEARALLLPYCPDMPAGPPPAELPPAELDTSPIRARIASGNGSRPASGAGRTSGKELVRTLADAAKLPPEKVRAKLRAAGLRAPYTDESACRKALGIKP